MPKKLQLSSLRYAHIEDGFGDSVPPRYIKGGSSKYVYLRDSKKFLKAVATILEVTTKISSNPGGTAVAGDTSFSVTRGDALLEVFLTYSEHKGHAQLVWRVGKDGANNWIKDPATSPEDVAQEIVGGTKG